MDRAASRRPHPPPSSYTSWVKDFDRDGNGPWWRSMAASQLTGKLVRSVMLLWAYLETRRRQIRSGLSFLVTKISVTVKW